MSLTVGISAAVRVAASTSALVLRRWGEGVGLRGLLLEVMLRGWSLVRLRSWTGLGHRAGLVLRLRRRAGFRHWPGLVL